MTLDAFDHVFVARWEARGTAPIATPRATEEPASGPPLPAPRATREDDPLGVDPAFVNRLLAVARLQWESLALEVEAARQAGHRVIAVTGREPAEGRSTLVACLGMILRERSREVVVRQPAGPPTHDLLNAGRHDRRIVLVDAGVWFPPGPIHRRRLLLASVGCDAAIVVRRACRPPAPAQAAALAAIGVTPLGEVVTFATAGDRASERPEAVR
jgi:hypothetical protein